MVVNVILDKYFEYQNKHRKILESENDSQYEGFRGNNENEKTKYIIDKLSNLTIHNTLNKLDRIELGMDFDDNSS